MPASRLLVVMLALAALPFADDGESRWLRRRDLMVETIRELPVGGVVKPRQASATATFDIPAAAGRGL